MPPRLIVRTCNQCKATFEQRKGGRALTCHECRSHAKKAQRRAERVRWKERNPEKVAAQKTRYKHRYRDRLREYKRGYDNKTRRNDSRVKLIANIRSRVAAALKVVRVRGRVPACRGAIRLLGCTIAELVAHVESQFEDGMTWSNFGRNGWHLDHIYPVSKADLTDRAQLLAAFNWKNCRPVWETDNLRKSAKVSTAAKQHFEELVASFRQGTSPPAV